MSDWIHALPLGWMALLIFGGTFLVAAVIHRVIHALAVGERARAFKGVTPGLLSPLGIIFGLLVAFIAAQVWGDLDRASTAVNREASALRAAVILADSFPSETAHLRGLIRQQIQTAQTEEWPAMARREASLTIVPAPIAEAMRTILALSVQGDGQVAAQREILASLEVALDSRRQRILLSQAGVSPAKWFSLVLQALCTLVAIAMVHSDNRATSAMALGLFSTAIAVCLFLITAHDRPFIGVNSVQPTVLLQVQPDTAVAPAGQ